MEISNVDKVREAYRLLGEALGVTPAQPNVTAPVMVANGIDDPGKAKLGPLGEWTPPLLASLAAKAEAKYPDGLSTDREFDFRSLSWARQPIHWPNAFWFTGALYKADATPARTDLTEEQRQKLQWAHNESFALRLIDPGMHLLMRIEGPYPAKGGRTAILAQTYVHDYNRLAKDIVAYFKRIGVE